MDVQKIKEILVKLESIERKLDILILQQDSSPTLTLGSRQGLWM